MIARGWYYFGLGWRDLVRLWSTTQHHVIIVAGICLPILMLLGLKRGHVETLRQDLITSPTGRQVTFWSAQRGELMNRAAIERLDQELPAVDVIIPETQRIAKLRSGLADHIKEVESATLYATRHGDPILAQMGLQPPEPGSRGIILGDGVAELLNAKPGTKIDVILTRGRGDLAETAQIVCTVTGIMPTDQKSAMIGYVDLDLLDQFDAYARGFRVEEFGWTSAKVSTPDAYASYLIFCEPGNDLTANDRRLLAERGFILSPCTTDPPAPLPKLLVPDFASKLIIYEAHTDQSRVDPKARLRIAPSELSEGTEASDVILAWNPSRTAQIGNQTWRMVGLSMARRTWLREYFAQPDLPFDYEAEALRARLADKSNTVAAIAWPLATEQSVDLTVDGAPVEGAGQTSNDAADGEPAPNGPAPAETTAKPPEPAANESNSTDSGTVADPKPNSDGTSQTETSTAPAESEEQFVVVPVNLLAWVSAHADGLVDYDADVRLFVPKQQPSVYDRARLYSTTVDDVPQTVSALADRGFVFQSENGRIMEIHRQDESLQLLVWVVGLGVFLFGIVTVFSVLVDSTDRKRGTIGILRVMGMSRAGIFTSVLLRATVIGAAAAMLSLLCGWGLALALAWPPAPELAWLQWKPIVTVRLNEMDLAVVAAGAMLCCALGAIPPAWKASRLDPFEAVVEGRFR